MEADDVYPMRCGNIASQHPVSQSVRSARTLRNSRARPVSLVPWSLPSSIQERAMVGQSSNTRTRSASSALLASRDTLQCRDSRDDTVFATPPRTGSFFITRRRAHHHRTWHVTRPTVHTACSTPPFAEGSSQPQHSTMDALAARLILISYVLHCGMVSARAVAMPRMPPCR